ncbi:hypothetical protein [Grimontia indica]|uniref:hypothetical protein n=1 Tax=Grimontia indica TaxID=1056512 RepID=UPI0005866CB3|nr:hypothetical protein [Grimontia indica]
MKWTIVRNISTYFLAALLLAILADLVVFGLAEHGRKGTDFVGCYAYDAMLIGFDCQGFAGSSIVTAWLNWPLWLLLAPMFALLNFKTLLLAVVVWTPVVAFIVSSIKLRSKLDA